MKVFRRVSLLLSSALLLALVLPGSPATATTAQLIAGCAPGTRTSIQVVDPTNAEKAGHPDYAGADTVGKWPNNRTDRIDNPTWYNTPAAGTVNPVIDATRAQWRIPTTVDGWRVPVKLTGVLPDNTCFVGGDLRVSNPFATTTWSDWHDGGAAGMFIAEPGFSVVGANIHNVGDGLQFTTQTKSATGFTVNRVHVSDAHDDCVQNDSMFTGTITDSFFDGCYMFYSSRDDNPSDGIFLNGANATTITVTNSLVHVRTMPTSRTVSTKPWLDGTPGHNTMWKLGNNQATGRSPKPKVTGTTFFIDGMPVNDQGGASSDPADLLAPPTYTCSGTEPAGSGCTAANQVIPYFPTANVPGTCSGNTIIWGGSEPTPPQLLAWQSTTPGNTCFTVVRADAVHPTAGTWRAQYGNLRRAWLASHSEGGAFVPLDPVQVLDGTVASGTPTRIDLSSVAALPSHAEIGALVLNVRAHDATSTTTLNVWGEGTEPTVPSLHVKAAERRTETVTVAPGRVPTTNRSGATPGTSSEKTSVLIANSTGSAGVAVDVIGYYRASPALTGDLYRPLTPVRALDSGTPGLTAGEIRDVTVAGGATGVPANATAVVVTLTAKPSATTSTSIKAWPKGGAEPAAERVAAGTANTPVANSTIVKVGTGGQISLKNVAFASTNVTADIVGYFVPPWNQLAWTGGPCTANPTDDDPCFDTHTVWPAGNPGSFTAAQHRFVPVVPYRAASSTAGTGWLAAGTTTLAPSTKFGAGEIRDLSLTGSTIPADARAVVVDVRIADVTGGPTDLRAGKTGVALTDRAVVLHATSGSGPQVTNPATIELNAGKLQVRNNAGTVNVFVDVVGYYR